MEIEGSQKRVVCIVDDDADLREIYTMAFKREGFEVATASNGREGLQMIRKVKPNAIILDLQMPVKNGFEVLEELKKDPEFSETPIVILSNVDDEKAFGEAENSNTCYYLIKVLTTPQKAVDIVCEALQDKGTHKVSED